MSSSRKYTCPYCKKSRTRDQLPGHLERNHLDVLPEGFTPLRMTFHIVNKKPLDYTRPCRICGGATQWDEHKGRYNFLCGKKSCHDAWVKKMQETMGDKMGSNRPTASKEGLAKMLVARKISGKYKFQDGGEHTYVGEYEHETLKFMDQVMSIKSEDVTTPGPFLEYQWEGKTHYYIPDIYYIPYNLIIEVKDGGKNPNKNQAMAEVRRRSIAKEKFIIENTDYNYLKLTDKDFSQLLSVFADLKMHMIDNDTSRVIHVNENTDIFDEKYTDADWRKNKNLSPVFVVNTFTGTGMGVLMQDFLNMKWSHALLSFTPSLKPMYSFDKVGFHEDDIANYKKAKNGLLRVIVLFVPPTVKAELKKSVDYYIKNKRKTIYGAINLIAYLNGSNNINSYGQFNIFCSEFVDAVLKNAKIDMSGHSSRNTSPDDLGGKDARAQFFKVYEGLVSEYSGSSIQKTITDLKKTIEYNKLTVNGGTNHMKDKNDIILGKKNSWPVVGRNALNMILHKTDSKNEWFDLGNYLDPNQKYLSENYHILTESLSIDNNKTDEIQSIIDTLSDKDKANANMPKNHKFDDSKTVKEIVIYDKNIPVAYFAVDFYKKDNEVNISLAVRSDYRNKGYGKKVAKQGTSWIKSNKKEFTMAYWATKPDNIESQKLAEENGWEVVRDDKEWKTYGIQGTKVVSESDGGGIPANCGTMGGVIVVNYLQNNVFDSDGNIHDKPEYGIADNLRLDNIVTTAGDKILHRESAELLINTRYNVYFVPCDTKKVYSQIESFINKPVPNNFIYEAVFGHKPLTNDQVMFENGVMKVQDFYQQLHSIQEAITDYIVYNIPSEAEEDKQILDKWFVKTNDGATNCCLYIRGYDKPFRGRSTMLILKEQLDGWYVYLTKENTYYSAPGGGWNENETPMEAAIRESREEVRINVSDVSYGGALIEYNDKVQDWVKQHCYNESDWWYGYYSRIYVGQYQSEFTGDIAEIDKDTKINTSEWFKVDNLIKDSKMSREYINAILSYISKKVKPVNESTYLNLDPSGLSEWMKKNIKYSNFTKLKSHDEVMKTKSGSCHDQVMFELEELKKCDHCNPKAMFLIEYNDKESTNATTHSFVYYKDNDKIMYFENAWKGHVGIKEFDSLKEIKDYFIKAHNNHEFGNVDQYPKLEFFNFGNHTPGESLEQFVQKCVS